MHVLMVEDDEATAQSMELMLRSEGMDIEVTDLGEEAIDLGMIHDYDVILLDLGLPDMSGYQVLRAGRTANVKTPVLIVSALTDAQDRIKGRSCGADDYITKPFHKADLVARMRAALRRESGDFTRIVTGELAIDLTEQTAEVGGERLDVTRQEYAALELLSLRKGMFVTQEMICNHVYGGMCDPEAGLIDRLVGVLARKLAEASGGRSCIEASAKRGYALR